MRTLFVLVVLGLLGYLGYDYATRGVGPSVAAEKRAGRPSGPGSSKAPAILVSEDRGDRRVRMADWARALLEGGFEGLGPKAELRKDLAEDVSARFALEVALSGRAGDSSSPELEAASERLSREGEKGLASKLQAAALLYLSEGGRPRAALSALASGNAFLASEKAGSGVASFRRSLASRPEEDACLLLSRFIDRLTSGGPVWEGRRYEHLKACVLDLDGRLRRLLFHSDGVWLSRRYSVQPGEFLEGIAGRFERKLGVPISPGFLMLVNGLSRPEDLRAGKTIRIPTERVRVVVEKGSHTLKCWLGDVLIRVFQVGLGRDESPTPETEYVVTVKLTKPIWYHPKTGEVFPYGHPENPLGEYFIKLGAEGTSGIGIHGTEDQASVGKNSSMGCLRLRQNDMTDLFRILPIRTPVLVRP